MVVVAVGLTLIQFLGSELTFVTWFGSSLIDGAEKALATTPDLLPYASPKDHPYYELYGLLHWVFFCVIGFVVLPCIYLKLCKRRISDMYLGTGELTSHLKVYLVLFLLVMAPVVFVSYSPEYQRIYPFYPHAGRSVFDLLAWELAYGLQFFTFRVYVSRIHAVWTQEVARFWSGLRDDYPLLHAALSKDRV